MSRQCLLAAIIQAVTLHFLIAEDSIGQGLKDTRLSVEIRNKRLVNIFEVIQEKTQYVFAYPDDIRKDNNRYSLSFKEETLDKVLIKLGEKARLKFKSINYTITVAFDESRLEEDEEEAPEYIPAIDVSGTVTDEANEPLPGVNVVVKGTTVGTSTDAEGRFAIAVPDENAVLVFSFIGFQSQEITVGSQTVINITMLSDIQSLDEIVVVGYGTQKKSDLTGAVAIVNSTELKKFSTNDIGAALQGRAAGVSVNSDGQPGAIPQVRIRGIGTIGNTDPLYVIDGVPVATIPREFSPNDIESIQVLKDASAGAIYGTRAMNGVIIITTKRGTRDTPLKVTYKGEYGVDKVWQRIPVTNSADYQMLNNEASDNNPVFPRAPGNNPGSGVYIDPDSVDTDWQNEGLKTGTRMNHNLSFTGGSKYTNYAFSLDYFDQEGTLVGNGPTYERYTVKASSDSEIGFFKIGQTIIYTHSHENTLVNDLGGLLAGGRPPVVGDLLIAIPTLPVYDPSKLGGFAGTLSTKEDVIILNPVGINSLVKSYVDVDRIFANLYASAKLFNKNGHSIEYKVNLGWDKTFTRDYSFIKPYDLGYFFQNPDARLRDGGRTLTTGVVENTLMYSGKAGNMTIDFLAGQAFQKLTTTNRGGTTFLNSSPPYFPVLDNFNTNTTVYGDLFESALASYFGRLNLNYGDRYLLTANIRRDGSSRFSPLYRYGNFPSVALAWKIHNESFLQLPAFISELKLRGGYGLLGSDQVPNYAYLTSINATVPYSFNGVSVMGATQTRIVSTAIKWEEKTTRNVALDMSFLGGKIDVTAEYYNNITEDVLSNPPFPNSTGANNDPFLNAISFKNSGVEITTTYRKITGDFTFDFSLNATTVKNRVLELDGGRTEILGAGAITRKGEELGLHYGYEYEGLFQSAEDIANHATQVQAGGIGLGDVMYKDQPTVDTDGDGVPDAGDGIINQDDRVVLGSGIPGMYYGINFNASYKNFDFTVFASGASGFKINSRTYRDLLHSGGRHNYHQDVLNRWTPENTNTDVPRVYMDDINNFFDSNRPGWLQDGSYLRINTVSLGYSVPTQILRGISNARLYVTMQNLYTFQGYKSFNPDFTSGVFNPGFDAGSYPKPRTVIVGVVLGL